MYEIIKIQDNREISLKDLACLSLYGKLTEVTPELDKKVKAEMMIIQSIIKYDTRILKKYEPSRTNIFETIYFLRENV
ncbi:hypothetical protein ACQ3MN_07710 [Enterococcus faecalis]|uniref:hypothetical protein n=1 Tax=Enterococcus faecalis TaxID=1351 RepID=UPI003D776E19